MVKLGSVTETAWRTHRLELDDQTLREWDATVLASGDDGIVLDQSAFYPGGGGQPPDHGVLLWGGVQTRIVGARKGDDLYLLPAEGDPVPPPGTAVRGAVEDERRTALMLFTMLVGSMQLARALSDRKLSNAVLEEGIHSALALLHAGTT